MFRGAYLGATRPRVWAVPAAPQAGLNKRIPRLQTLSPAKRNQEVTDLKPCLPPLDPPENFWRPSPRLGLLAAEDGEAIDACR